MQEVLAANAVQNFDVVGNYRNHKKCDGSPLEVLGVLPSEVLLDDPVTPVLLFNAGSLLADSFVPVEIFASLDVGFDVFREEVRVTLELVELGAAEGGPPAALDKPAIEKEDGEHVLFQYLSSTTIHTTISIISLMITIRAIIGWSNWSDFVFASGVREKNSIVSCVQVDMTQSSTCSSN